MSCATLSLDMEELISTFSQTSAVYQTLSGIIFRWIAIQLPPETVLISGFLANALTGGAIPALKHAAQQ